MADILPEKLNNQNELKVFLAKNYMAQIKNFFGDEKQAMKFLSSVMADVQRNPKLMECTPSSLVNSYITMAQMGFMPSGISGEAYVLPYKKGYVMEAQLQVGYQGLVTLYYGAGVDKITSGIVREKDKTTLINGELTHEVDLSLSQEERGKPIGAYVTAIFRGEKSTKYMNGKDIVEHAKKYSKSYDPVGKYSPWNPDNDRELWMWVKTVIKQHKLLPKNEKINQALNLDNTDSRISDVKEKLNGGELTMGGFLANNNNENTKKDPDNQESGHKEESVQIGEEGTGEDNKGFTDSIKS